MSLTDDLANLAAQMQSTLPPHIIVTMEQAAVDLLNAAIHDRALTVGDTIPDFTLSNAIGQRLRSQNYFNQVPLFYRSIAVGAAPIAT